MHQRKYVNDLFLKFNMKDYNATIIPFETGIKLSKKSKEKNVDPTLFT